jgi:hypothetical protein
MPEPTVITFASGELVHVCGLTQTPCGIPCPFRPGVPAVSEGPISSVTCAACLEALAAKTRETYASGFAIVEAAERQARKLRDEDWRTLQLLAGALPDEVTPCAD